MSELSRERTDIPASGYCLDVVCQRCGKPLRLWYNGGELDYRKCCGLVYELDAPRIDFVVREADEDD